MLDLTVIAIIFINFLFGKKNLFYIFNKIFIIDCTRYKTAKTRDIVMKRIYYFCMINTDLNLTTFLYNINFKCIIF